MDNILPAMSVRASIDVRSISAVLFSFSPDVEGRLAGAVRTKQTKNFTLVHDERQILHDLLVAKAHRERLDIYDRHYFIFFLCLKNSTCRSRFTASSLVLYGPPKFLFVFSERT